MTKSNEIKKGLTNKICIKVWIYKKCITKVFTNIKDVKCISLII